MENLNFKAILLLLAMVLFCVAAARAETIVIGENENATIYDQPSAIEPVNLSRTEISLNTLQDLIRVLNATGDERAYLQALTDRVDASEGRYERLAVDQLDVIRDQQSQIRDLQDKYDTQEKAFTTYKETTQATIAGLNQSNTIKNVWIAVMFILTLVFVTLLYDFVRSLNAHGGSKLFFKLIQIRSWIPFNPDFLFSKNKK